MTDQEWRTRLDRQQDEHLKELVDILRIPSVSTDPERRNDVRRTATIVADRLRAAGVPDVIFAESAGHPAVIGRWLVDESQPTILIYGHFDVQPAEPLALWDTDAFEPAIRNGKLYARGSSDMKGNLLTAIQGVEAVAASNGGQPPINVKFIFEGEEEIGSPNLRAIVREHRDRLKADAVVSADGGQHGPGLPSQSVALKGLGGCQVNLTTARSDLHSGMYGATVPNAVQALVQLAATFHDAGARVTVDGFYNKVKDLTSEERAEIAAVPFDEDELKREVGLDELWGETGWSPRERQWGRPTLDMNGIWGGFQGDGVKTVTPREAHLKITCRLVPDQDPVEVVDLIQVHVEAHRPPGATVEVVSLPGSARPFVLDRSNPVHLAVGDVLRDLFGKEPLVVRTGGTVPATGIFKEELGIDTATLGWSMPGSGAHAPNEWYRIEDYYLGRVGYAALIDRLKR